MRLVLVARTAVATDAVRLRLVDPGGAALPPFAPGAHVEFSFAGMTRRYSLTSLPDVLDAYEVCVLRTDPGGGGSAYLHDRLEVGDGLEVSTPCDAFPLAPDAEHSVFVAGGIGVTPFVTMMHALAAAGRSFELHHAARSAERMIAVDTHGRPAARYVSGDGRRALDVAALLGGLDRAAHLYICGPRALIEAVRLGAAERGWPRDRVRFESFGAQARPTDRPIEVRLAMTGTTLTVPVGTPILDAMLEAGVWASYECRRGECGSCHVEVLTGEADHRDVCLTTAQRAHGLCTCVSWARSETIELNL